MITLRINQTLAIIYINIVNKVPVVGLRTFFVYFLHPHWTSNIVCISQLLTFHQYLPTSYFEPLIFYFIHIFPLFCVVICKYPCIFYSYIKAYCFHFSISKDDIDQLDQAIIKVKLQFKNSSICYLPKFRIPNLLSVDWVPPTCKSLCHSLSVINIADLSTKKSNHKKLTL